MRHHLVELLGVKTNEPSYGRHGIERVQIQPLVSEPAPPCLYHRVGFDYLNLRKHSLQDATEKEFVAPPLSKIDPFVLGRIDPGWDREVS